MPATQLDFALLNSGGLPLNTMSSENISSYAVELETQLKTASKDNDEDVHVTTIKRRHRESIVCSSNDISSKRLRNLKSNGLLELPPEVLHILCDQYLDTVTRTCLGLTCKTLFHITEDYWPWQTNLYMRTRDRPKICLGHLLTDWMAPKYSFDHSWGKFLKRKYYVDDKKIEEKWKIKEQWQRIRLKVDKAGAAVAYNSSIRGF